MKTRGKTGLPAKNEVVSCDQCLIHEAKILDLLSTISTMAKDLRIQKATIDGMRTDMNELAARLLKIEKPDEKPDVAS